MKSIFQRPGNYWRNFALKYFGLILFGLFVIVPLIIAYLVAHPRRYPVSTNIPPNLEFTYESVTLNATDGVKLAGWYIPSKNGAAIIAVHGHDGNRLAVLLHATALARHGYGILLFDMRGFGESEGCFCPEIEGAVQDVHGAVDYLQQRSDVDPERIGALGLSAGAMVILRAAAEDDDIQAVLADGADEFRIGAVESESFPWFIREYIRYNSSMVFLINGNPQKQTISEAVRQITPRSLFLIAAGPEYELQDNRSFYAAAGEPKQLWELPGTPHTYGILAYPQEYELKMQAFFQQALLDRDPSQ